MNKKANIQQLQNNLYQLAKKVNQRFPNLYSKVYQTYVLEEAWNRIKVQKGNGRLDASILQKAEAYGIGKLIRELQAELRYEAYRIMPPLPDWMDKDLTLAKDRILQMAIKLVIYPIFKFDLNLVNHTDHSGVDAPVKMHRSACYDNISQDKLLQLLERRISDHELLHLIQQSVTMGTIYIKGQRPTYFGLDKTSVLSPLLMSIYYHYYDQLQAKPPLLLTNQTPDNPLTNNPSPVIQDSTPHNTTTQDLLIPKPHHELEDMPTSSTKPEEELPTVHFSEQATGSFCGYKYRFGLYAAHSNVNNSEDNMHFHTFTITIYVHAGSDIDHNYGIEKVLQDWLEPLQGKKLSSTDLFNGKATTIEGIGDTLYDPISDLVNELGYELIKLSISENPIRVYSVSEKRLDSSINQINAISLDCIPIIDLEDNVEDPEIDSEVEPVAQTETELEEPVAAMTTLKGNSEHAYEEEYLKDIAATLELEEETPIESSSNPSLQRPKVMVVLLKSLLGLGCFVALAMLVMYIVKDSGRYPQGDDAFCHLYRADLLLESIKNSNWFPLYDEAWYNGVEIMRYWGPLPLYILAGLEWFSNSNPLDAYILYLGFIIILGGCGWLLWGITYRRIGLSILIGSIWLFMPENIRVVIYEGNLPRGVINALLPFFFYFLWRVMSEKKRHAIPPLIIVTSLITLCHLGITLMLIATTIIFVLFHALMNHTGRSSFVALGACISGVLLTGLWVVPALIGGAASGSSTNQVMKNFFESIFISLNPLMRPSGDLRHFYFGLSVFLICIMGTLLGSKKSKAGFITALVLLICTSKSVYELFEKLPFSQFLWMIRFIPIGLATSMVSFLLWKQLKKSIVLLFSLFLLFDCATSYYYIYFPKEQRISNVQADIEQRATETLLTSAKAATSQRMALLDLSRYVSFAPYYISGVGKRVNYTFGAGWEGAGTASNIVNLNASVENGWYVYLFDRALELGNDTVLIPIDNLKGKSKDIDKLIEAARILGYYPIENDGSSILFHKETPEQFGVVTKYKDIAIGEAASGIAMIFPRFEEGSKDNINDYTYEELSTYRSIYLSGITYSNKDEAEALLLKLSQNGVKIYIDMNRIPMDEVKKSMELFGVVAQNISFSESFPVFSYLGNNYSSLDFLYNAGDWSTVYLLGLEQVEGSCDMTNRILPFLGTAKNDNLHFIGLNLIYYLQMSRDAEIMRLAEAIFNLQETSVPEREVVPIAVENGNNRIIITSDYDQVNTTLSYIDIFHNDRPIRVNNNLITVNSGTTVLNIKYPHTEKGAVATIIGLILAIVTYLSMRRVKEQKRNTKETQGTN